MTRRHAAITGGCLTTASSPRAHVAFKDRDVRRLIKAARAAGINPTVIEVNIKTGLIRVISGKSDDAGNDLDKWLEGHHESPSEGH